MCYISVSLYIYWCAEESQRIYFHILASQESFMFEESHCSQSIFILNLRIFIPNNQEIHFYINYISPPWSKKLRWHHAFREENCDTQDIVRKTLKSFPFCMRFPPFFPLHIFLILKAFPTNAWNPHYAAYGFYYQVYNAFRNFFDFSGCYLILFIPWLTQKQRPKSFLSIFL